MSGSTSDCIHSQTTEQECHHRTEKHTGKYLRIHQIYLIIVHKIHKGSIGRTDRVSIRKSKYQITKTSQPNADLLNIRSQQCQPRKSSRANGKTFSGSSRCISQRIERIGAFTHLLTQRGHLRIATGIVGYRTVSIRSKRNAQCRKHTDSSNTDAVKSHSHIIEIKTGSQQIGSNNTDYHCHHRNSCGQHAESYTRNDDCGRTRFATFTQFLSRPVRLGSIIFRRTADNNTHNQSYNYRTRNPHPIVQL